MENVNKSVYAKEYHPFWQAVVALGGAAVFMILGALMNAVAGVDLGIKFPWTTAGAFILMYAVFNSVNSFSTKNMLHYYRNSVFGFIGLLLGGSLLAYLFSQTHIRDAGSFAWIYVMLCLAYFGFIGITTFIRFIFSILRTEEEKLSKRIDDI